MDLTNKETISRIDECIKIIMVNKTIEDIPLILVLLIDLIGDNLQLTELETCISSLHEYIVAHYDVFDNSEDMRKFNDMFSLCSKLLLYQPNIKKKHCFKFSCI